MHQGKQEANNVMAMMVMRRLGSEILPPPIDPGLSGSASSPRPIPDRQLLLIALGFEHASSPNPFRIVQKRITKQSTYYPNLQEQAIKNPKVPT